MKEGGIKVIGKNNEKKKRKIWIKEKKEKNNNIIEIYNIND